MEEKKLIIANFINGNSFEQLERIFKITEKEVINLFYDILARVKNYRFQRCMPFIDCDTLEKARKCKAEFLWCLERITLDVLPTHKIISHSNLSGNQFHEAIKDQKK